MTINLATKLTLARIAAIPVIVVLMLIPSYWAVVSAFVIFILAGITDWLDGYIARRYNQVSRLGQMLDPIADKLLIVTILIVLTGKYDHWGPWFMLPSSLIILREIFVAGLREYLAGQARIVPVSVLAKWKTAFQFMALGYLVILPLLLLPFYQDSSIAPTGLMLTALGFILLWIAAVLSLKTAWDYWRANKAIFQE